MLREKPRWMGIVLKVSMMIFSLAGLVVLLAWMGGAFHDKIAPGEIPIVRPPARDRVLFEVVKAPTEETLDIVASVQPRHQAEVASQIIARVRDVLVDPGTRVKVNQELITLDDEELLAQQREALAALAQSEADLSLRKRDSLRYRQLLNNNNVSKEEFDRITSTETIAEAQVKRSRQQVDRINVQLGYTHIRASSPGVIADRYVNKGDLAVPGKALLTLHDTRELELQASVPESQALRISPGQKLRIRIEAAHINAEGVVREIVPMAQQITRSVIIKVGIPADLSAPVFAGMFGRVTIPIGKVERILIPTSAVRNRGQLTLVDVASDQMLDRRFVRVGRIFENGMVEVLTGLAPGERVALPPK